MADEKEASLKPRSIRGLSIMLMMVMISIIPRSTRAYIPYVQPTISTRPLPEVKAKEEPKHIVVKKIKGYGTGYFGPRKEDYKTKAAYLEAIRMNGKGEQTTSGTKPRIGTIAADEIHYPAGTIIFIPEINLMATVEDTGPKVKGRKHIDIFCGYGKQAEKIAKTWGPGTPITLMVMKPV